MEIVRGGVVSKLLEGVPIPKMFRAKQSFPRPLIKREDIPAAVWQAMEGERVASLIKPGMNIAITAGSRGIANVDVITKAIVDFVKKKGAHPFIVPAMGSHGGATAEGQLQILEGYNITEENMGLPYPLLHGNRPFGNKRAGKTCLPRQDCLSFRRHHRLLPRKAPQCLSRPL